MSEKKQEVQSALQAALEEVDRRAASEKLQPVERMALAWMIIQYSGVILPSKLVPSLVEAVIRHPRGYSVETVHGLMLASPIAKRLLAGTMGFHPSRKQRSHIQEMYSQITTYAAPR
jgi:hypothetical protein